MWSMMVDVYVMSDIDDLFMCSIQLQWLMHMWNLTMITLWGFMDGGN